MNIGIVGMGHVGTAMAGLFPDACVYDPAKGLGSRESVNECDAAFVCVPTPALPDGGCDTAIVEEVVGWLETELIVIRSTVPVGFCDRLHGETGKNIVFQPEYYGETVGHPLADLGKRTWLVLGGERRATSLAVRVYQTVYSADVRILITDARTAELAKYMENAFLATKVVFCNEFYDLAGAFGVDYNQLREIFVEDPRMGRSHTFVYADNRGFAGSCLPKDVSSIVKQGEDLGLNVDLLAQVLRKNAAFRE